MTGDRQDALRWILAGVFLLIAGWSVLFLIVLRLLPTSLWLNLLAYGANLAGLFIGLYGILEYRHTAIHR